MVRKLNLQARGEHAAGIRHGSDSFSTWR